jgi:hypothetical protein
MLSWGFVSFVSFVMGSKHRMVGAINACTGMPHALSRALRIAPVAGGSPWCECRIAAQIPGFCPHLEQRRPEPLSSSGVAPFGGVVSQPPIVPRLEGKIHRYLPMTD